MTTITILSIVINFRKFCAQRRDKEENESGSLALVGLVVTSMSQSTRKKTGAPDPKQYDSNDVVAKFDPVRQWLIKNCKKVCVEILLHYVST